MKPIRGSLSWRRPVGAASAIRAPRRRRRLLLLLLTPLSMGRAQQPSPPTQNALAGSWVFGAKGCANCHAINGVGKAVGPDLGRGELHSYYDLAAAFWNHHPGMAARMRQQGIEPPRMTPAQMGDLIAFLTSVNYFDAPGNAEKGKTVFAEKRCIACHQVGGAGGVVGPNLDYLGQTGSPIQVAAAMWNHGPAMRDAMRRLGIERPSLTPAELKDLLAYLRAASPEVVDRSLSLLPGRADLGRRWIENKGCLRCHSILGQGGTRAPDLARRERPLSLLEFAATLWNKAPAMLQVMGEQGIAAPHLEASEMADIVAYLYSVQYFQPQGNAATGRGLFESRGCLGCHSLGGRGSKPAGDLARVRNLRSLTEVITAMWNHVRVAPKVVAGQSRWPKLTPGDVANITAFFLDAAAAR